jgi:hypothetical protein
MKIYFFQKKKKDNFVKENAEYLGAFYLSKKRKKERKFTRLLNYSTNMCGKLPRVTLVT